MLPAVVVLGLFGPRVSSAQSPCAEDRTEADFSLGLSSIGVYLSLTGDGEVLLSPALGTEFSGSGLSLDWAAFPWGGGGGGGVAGGVVTVDGARVNSEPEAGYAAGHSLEFVAIFDATPFQHVGFGGGTDLTPGEEFNTAPWAIFSTGAAGTELQARTWTGAPMINTPLPSVALGVPHRFRIDWTPTSIDYYVDGALVHSDPEIIPGPMRPAISDFAVGGPVVVADWMRMSPYPSSGVFESRAFDAGVITGWTTMTWSEELPAGTSLGMEVRTGNTPVPDGSWTSYVGVPSSGTNLALSSQYIQYRATLATVDPAVTPALLDVQINCSVATPTRPSTWGGLKRLYR